MKSAKFEQKDDLKKFLKILNIKKPCLEIVQDKRDYLTQETHITLEELRKVEGDRRRGSMYVEGVLDPTHYVAGLADFLLTISSSMEETLRPPQPNGRRGKTS